MPLLIVSCVPTIDEILYPVGREILYPAQPLLLQLCRVVNSAIMTPLRCCSFNCRRWNSGLVALKSFINSLDICFIQEHWLLNDHLHRIHEISPDFLSVSVSGINASNLLCGRPSILYRKSPSSVISPLDSNSHRFCGVKMVDSATSYLLISVYMPTDYGASSVSDFLHTLGELEGFIVHNAVMSLLLLVILMLILIVMVHWQLLNDFIIELDLSVCDLSFRDKVKFTYERDDGACHSWIDHVLCSQSHSSLINPRRACARVTVVVLCVCLSVCLSVCYRSSGYSIRLYLQPTTSMGFS